tara:strand:+ start:1268 stop:2320 length:1053 start_codon:yes stop_codon:yes gene_type:complete
MAAKNNYLISIIIPHWNGIEVLSECLSSLKKSTFKSFEIIIVDNASEDGSQLWIKENHPDIILLENNKNYGYAGGCNRGADIAKGKYLLFLNNDTVLNSDWLQPLFDKINGDDNIAAIQPKILNYYENDVFDYAGGAGGYMDLFCYPFARGRIFFDQEIDTGQYNKAQKCFWASGTALMLRKELFNKAGKFDEIFFAHMEEIDLCWKFQSMGYDVWSEPKSIVYHKNALSLPMYSHRKYFLNHRNSLLMLLGNYSLLTACYIGIIRFMLEFVALAYTIFKLDINHFTGILRSLIWVIFHPITILRKRLLFKKIRVLNDKDIMNSMLKKSIVFSYYIGRVKTYLEIESKAS